MIMFISCYYVEKIEESYQTKTFDFLFFLIRDSQHHLQAKQNVN